MELAPRTRRNRQEYGRLRAYGWLWAASVAAAAVLFIFTALFTAIRVSDAGMAPFIEENDILLFGRLSRHLSAPERGDVIAFRAQKNGPTYIGRVVGLPGERVAIAGGKVYIGGLLLDESAYASGAPEEFAETKVPAGCFFILPDAREYAELANAASLFVPGNNILGTARVRVSPLGRIALFE